MRPLVVFDLDGTLVDSARDLAESANEMLQGYGAAPVALDEIAGMVGDGARQLVVRALAAAGLTTDVSAALERFLGAYAARMLRHTRPYPDLAAVVAAAGEEAALAVLTNKPTALARELLAAFDLARHFTWIVGGDGPFPRKPDPSGLRYLMSEAGTSSAATLMIGDSMIDVETARHAGTRVCVAGYGFGHLRRPLALQPGEDVVADAAELRRWIGHFLIGVQSADPGGASKPT